MASLSFRRSSLVRTAGQILRPAATTDVMPCKYGGIATSSSSGATITMAAGHGFAAGDKILIDPGSSQVFSGSASVTSFTPTTITMTSGSYTVAIGNVIWNLGADTATGTTPNYNAPVTCYTGPSAATTLATANSNNGYAVTNADGEFQYWHLGGPIWELYLQSAVVVEYDISSGYPMGGQLILREPVPYATGFGDTTELRGGRAALRIFGADSTDPLLSFRPFSATDTYPILLRVGGRANTTGDSRTVGYFSEDITDPGSSESQAVFGIQVYRGSATATQLGIHGLVQSVPSAGNTIAQVKGVQGWATHTPSVGVNGTTSILIGVYGQAQIDRAGTVSSAYASYNKVSLSSTGSTTVGSAVGVYGLIEKGASFSGALTNAYAAKFDQPDFGTNRYALYLGNDGSTGGPIIGFAHSSGTKTISWDIAAGRFKISADLEIDGGNDLYVDDDIEAGGYIKAGTVFWTTDTTIGYQVGNAIDENINLIKVLNGDAVPPRIAYESATRSLVIGKADGLVPTKIQGGIRLTGDNVGVASTVSFTGTTAAMTNTNTATIRTAAAAANNAGWIKIYVGTTAHYIPYFLDV